MTVIAFFRCRDNAENIAIDDIFNCITKDNRKRKGRYHLSSRKYKSEIGVGKCQNGDIAVSTMTIIVIFA